MITSSQKIHLLYVIFVQMEYGQGCGLHYAIFFSTEGDITKTHLLKLLFQLQEVSDSL